MDSSRPESKITAAPSGDEAKRPAAVLKRNVLFSVHVNLDGLGDIGHLTDIANPTELKKNLPKKDSFGRDVEYQPIYLVDINVCSPPRVRYIVKKLIDCGILNNEGNPYNIEDDAQLQKCLLYLQEKNPHVYLNDQFTISFTGSLLKYSSDDGVDFFSTLKQQLKQTRGHFQVSMDRRLLKEEADEYPFLRTFIGEHKGFKEDLLNHTFFQSMGASPQQKGFLLSRPTHITLQDKADALIHLENKAYLCDLMERKDASGISQQEAVEFLQNTLFIPAYLHTRTYNTNLDLIHIFSQCKLAEKYKNIAFHLKEFDEAKLNLAALGASGISTISIHKPDQEPKILALWSGVEGRHVNIYVGYFLSEHDYLSLFKIAQHFAGCSGDKTLELCLSNALIPFYTEMPWKAGLTRDLQSTCQMLASHDADKKISKFFDSILLLHHHYYEYTANADLKALIDDNFVALWQSVFPKLYEQFNFYNALPEIIQNGLRIGDLDEAIETKNYAIAMSILGHFKTPEEQNYLFKWAFEAKQWTIAAFIYQQYKDSLKEEIEPDKLQILKFVAKKLEYPGFSPTGPKVGLFEKKSTEENYDDAVIKHFFAIFHQLQWEHHCGKTVRDIYKDADPALIQFTDAFNQILENTEKTTSDQFIEIGKLLIDLFDKPTANAFCNSLLEQLQKKANFPIMLFLNLKDEKLDNTPKSYPILVKALQLKMAELEKKPPALGTL